MIVDNIIVDSHIPTVNDTDSLKTCTVKKVKISIDEVQEMIRIASHQTPGYEWTR